MVGVCVHCGRFINNVYNGQQIGWYHTHNNNLKCYMYNSKSMRAEPKEQEPSEDIAW